MDRRSVSFLFRISGALCLALCAAFFCALPAFSQEACAIPPLPLPAAAPEADDPLLWTLVLLSSRWDYDVATGSFHATALVFNTGRERVRGAGVQLMVRDGSNKNIAVQIQLAPTPYLEAQALVELSFSALIPLARRPAAVLFETVAVTGSCGW